MTAVTIKPQPESYESTLTTRYHRLSFVGPPTSVSSPYSIRVHTSISFGLIEDVDVVQHIGQHIQHDANKLMELWLFSATISYRLLSNCIPHFNEIPRRRKSMCNNDILYCSQLAV